MAVEAGAGGVILVMGADDCPRAYVDSCPHTGASLDGGEGVKGRLTREADALICLWHGALFNRETGLCFAGPCAGKALSPVAIRTEAGMIYLA